MIIIIIINIRAVTLSPNAAWTLYQKVTVIVCSYSCAMTVSVVISKRHLEQRVFSVEMAASRSFWPVP